ncbi:uncharacterized protein CIMG_03509 [Coccidioides immitis RS]|uniref:DNA-directed RNA polymerase III subunit RPC9 n=3 Tax=Coccidioides immitis TaxID=5501 RepID=A0A0E1RXR0_COCIM|nr:uncharacterized protein CIMG_03509 [Coccidioides immitis RS]EAS32485.1 hypothetical protein CIMG_03509 [Coccidioides immitis RS]KMP07722.1 hypothetical protein CIRG_07403 [Coccidioides immitis RMSCC 2394]KMU71825.1 hypothetical protein CISG_00134 [Coccidioides immitis RMSCC 3703]
MKILDSQSAILTNVEVLAHFTLNPPHRLPQPPPNARNFTPHPDLRDHNTVVKEFHNYVTRLSPHLLKYPSFLPKPTATASSTAQNGTTTTTHTQQDPDSEQTDLDIALRTIITRLKPFNLTKAEVLTIINLGVGLDINPEGEGAASPAEEDTVMLDGNVNGEASDTGDGGAKEEEADDAGDEDYGALALLDTVIEDREERLSNEDISEILKIIRETLGGEK